MFGIDFSEIVVIFVIALVVLGPEKLPKLAATIGRWLGRARSMARQFREQLEHEANRLNDTVDLKDLNAQRSAYGPYAGHGSSYQGAPAAAASSPPPPGATPAQPEGAPSAPAPSAVDSGMPHAPAQEFGLHNAGAPETAAGTPEAGPGAAPAGAFQASASQASAPPQPQPHGSSGAPQEPPVAVEAHER